ncbi:MAG: Rho termination factor N-terminal domain-containing protein [Candidatus Heimdallarchaeaceae archaeon]
MEINANVYHLLNVLLQVVLWSLIISAPAIILTIEMYAYERYKKWKDKTENELERIIVGKTNNKDDLEKEIKLIGEDKRRLELDVELLEIRKNALTPEAVTEELEDEPINETTEEPEVEKLDLNNMTVLNLQELARKHNLKWYSRMKKVDLVKALESLV